MRGDLRHCAGDRRRRSAPSAALGPDLSRAGGGVSASLYAEHYGVMAPESRRHTSLGLVRGLNKPLADHESSLAPQRRLLSAQFHLRLTFARTVPFLPPEYAKLLVFRLGPMKSNRSHETAA